MDKNCLDSLVALPDVIGAFLSHRNGQIAAHRMPEYLALDQVEKATRMLNQHHGAATVALGHIQRCELRYFEHKIFIYYFPQGQLVVLCRPKANAQRIDFEIELFRDELLELLQQVDKEPSPPVTAAGKSSTPADPKKKGTPWLLVALVVLLLAVGGGFFYFQSGSNSPSQQAAVAKTDASPPPTKTKAVATPPVAKPAGPTETLLRISGSATIGEKLMPEITMAFMKQEMFAGDVRWVQADQTGVQRIEATLGDGRHVAIELLDKDSNAAFACLDQGSCDLGMSSRPITDTEVTLLDKLGPMNSPASEHVLALDGLTVILHPVNNLDVLSGQQLMDIFTGKITTWEQLPESGQHGDIHIYSKAAASGAAASFRMLALHGEDMHGNITYLDTDNILADKVAEDTQGIGFVALPYSSKAKAIAILEEGTGSSVYPTAFTIATEDYPLTRRLYLYMPANPKNFLIRPFVQFALGETGQVAAKKYGFVSLTIDKSKPAIPASAPAEYRDEVANASRLSLDFRFKTGSSELDTRARRDLERLVAFLIRPENRNKSIKLFGFTDSLGERKANCYLSAVRAEKVATILQWRGIKTETSKGLCDAMPVASNENPLGRQKNRRVEVWLND